jgi:hypothetical protein
MKDLICNFLSKFSIYINILTFFIQNFLIIINSSIELKFLNFFK